MVKLTEAEAQLWIQILLPKSHEPHFPSNTVGELQQFLIPKNYYWEDKQRYQQKQYVPRAAGARSGSKLANNSGQLINLPEPPFSHL